MEEKEQQKENKDNNLTANTGGTDNIPNPLINIITNGQILNVSH